MRIAGLPLPSGPAGLGGLVEGGDESGGRDAGAGAWALLPGRVASGT